MLTTRIYYHITRSKNISYSGPAWVHAHPTGFRGDKFTLQIVNDSIRGGKIKYRLYSGRRSLMADAV